MDHQHIETTSGALSRRGLIGGTAAIAVAGIFANASPASAASGAPPVPADTASRLQGHLDALAAIAASSGGDRADGTPGYARSVSYVEEALLAARIPVRRQSFEFDLDVVDAVELVALSPVARPMTPFRVPGSTATPGDGIEGDLVLPRIDTGLGEGAWDGVDAAGKVALIRIDTSTGDGTDIDVTAVLQGAQAAGAVGVLLHLYDLLVPIEVRSPDAALPPVLNPTATDAASLLSDLVTGPVRVRMTYQAHTEHRRSCNLLAGDPDATHVTGAHLDSVAAGPGMNDNGAGAALLLEAALLDARRPGAGELYAWWGAHEVGLHGSEAFVRSGAAASVTSYLNLEIVGSVNPVVTVYGTDARQELKEAVESTGSPWIEFTPDHALGSDHEPFEEAGIATAGLVSYGIDGALKTEEEAELFGGTAGQPYNPHYHDAGDDIDNVSAATCERFLSIVRAFHGTRR